MSTGFTKSIVHSTISKQGGYSYRSGMGMVDSAEWVVYFDDFLSGVTSNSPDDKGWLAAVIDTGATLVAGASNAGGTVDISSDGANEGVTICLSPLVQLSGKRFYMEIRGKVLDADDNDLVFGLSSSTTGATNPEDFWDTTSTDFIAFGPRDGDATPILDYDESNTGIVTDTPSGTAFDLSDDTYATLAISYNGSTTASLTGAIECFVNGQLAVTSGTQARIPDDVVLTPFIGSRVGATAADINTIDYVRLVLER